MNDKVIDLHSHLGSLTKPRNLWRIMNNLGINIGIKTYEDFIKTIYHIDKDNHTKYLEKFILTHKIQSSPQAIQECVYLAVEDAYIDNKLHGIEIRFNPMLRNWDGHFNLDSVILNACVGLQRALQAFPIKAGIIISTDKQFTEKEHMILLEKAMKYRNLGIVGIDCSGKVNSCDDIRKLEKMYVNCNELKKTVHAGELNSIGSVEKWSQYEIKFAIEHLGVQRIGHGIQCYKDEKLMEQLRQNNICLEICPTSNVVTGIFEDYSSLFEKVKLIHEVGGVDITLNTDGNVFLNTSIENEFSKFYGHLDTLIEIKQEMEEIFKENSLKHTFL